jgi:nicotinamide riboside transporter PnuC
MANNKKEVNWFFVIIIFIIGLALMKDISFKPFALKKPALDTLYIIIFLIALGLVLKDLFKKSSN